MTSEQKQRFDQLDRRWRALRQSDAQRQSDAEFERLKTGLVRVVDAQGRVFWTSPQPWTCRP